MAKNIFCLFFLFLMSVSTYGSTWEEEDGIAFEAGDVAAVKRILSQTNYSGELLIQAFETSVMSGNIDLVKFLDKKGWLEICRKDKRCDPVSYAVMSRIRPAMLTYLLSRGFKPTSGALYFASAKVTPDDETISDSLKAVKILCEGGANPSGKGARDASELGQATALQELEKRQTENTMDLGSPLRSARGEAAEVVVASFFKSGACKKGAMATTDFDDYLATVLAFRHGDIQAIASVLTPSPHFKPRVETYLLYEAVASGNLDLLERLKSDGWISRCRGNMRCRPIDVAAEIGANQQTLQFLAAEGFDIDSINTSGGTPLMYAALNANVNAVKFLCERGADSRKRVKLEVYERSIISILRRSYSSSWCSAVVFGAYPKSTQDKARLFCEQEGGSLVGPQSMVVFPECVPGNSCLSIPFPPKGQDGNVRELSALADIFQYLKSGQCKPAQSAPVCTENVAPRAVIISENVNLRAQPTSTSAKVEALPFGTVLEVIDSTRGCELLSDRAGRWIRAKVFSYPKLSDNERPKTDGWVFDAYVDYYPSFEP